MVKNSRFVVICHLWWSRGGGADWQFVLRIPCLVQFVYRCLVCDLGHGRLNQVRAGSKPVSVPVLEPNLSVSIPSCWSMLT
jgi:hypothetical protein